LNVVGLKFFSIFLHHILFKSIPLIRELALSVGRV
jgi:hypothetical protein